MLRECTLGSYYYYYYSGSWPYHDRVLLFVEDPGHSFVLCRNLVDFPGNRVCGGYCIDYGYSDMCLSETYSSERSLFLQLCQGPYFFLGCASIYIYCATLGNVVRVYPRIVQGLMFLSA